jgi:hypothetical protein
MTRWPHDLIILHTIPARRDNKGLKKAVVIMRGQRRAFIKNKKILQNRPGTGF